ncbi:hypothetical protein SAR11G3_01027 [Candidatus Pelagibacter sp. IMCC9063]|nr:hypothetical protein SAR11G3_01027 [Candidatus Pelagibacter sp. IMCC9063]
MIKVATPKPIPKNEKIEMILRMPSFFLGFKYLLTIRSSDCVIN